MTGIEGETAIVGLVLGNLAWPALLAAGKIAPSRRRTPRRRPLLPAWTYTPTTTAGVAADRAPATPAAPARRPVPDGPRRPASHPPRNPKLAAYASQRPRDARGAFVPVNGAS